MTSAKFSRLWTPSLPIVSTRFTQPSFLWSEFSQPPPSPLEQTSYVHAPLWPMIHFLSKKDDILSTYCGAQPVALSIEPLDHEPKVLRTSKSPVKGWLSRKVRKAWREQLRQFFCHRQENWLSILGQGSTGSRTNDAMWRMNKLPWGCNKS